METRKQAWHILWGQNLMEVRLFATFLACADGLSVTNHYHQKREGMSIQRWVVFDCLN